MKNILKESMGVSLKEVKEKFKAWRESNKRRRKIPEELWKLAVNLYPEYTMSKINSTLSISYSKLKKKINEKNNNSEIIKKDSFIEFKLDSLISKKENNETIILEIKSINGTQLKIYSSENIDFNFICQEFINKIS